ncbi:MAG: 23S rRNA (uracil(1939)-C(5))-methyltransferase RlmD [Clostridia bacterium]|nr:23S rRNA (uracil(1939)-C(5))-methyltransferase RlmD [Clostridia bacterium]
MDLKKNDVLTVDIIDITDLGFGVAKIGGAVIFVSDTVPGDKAEIKIIKATPSYFIARLEELISPSVKRVSDRCPLAQCKSCAYKNLSYENELIIKENGVRETFKKAGLSHVRVASVISSPDVCRYRNKAQYPIGKTKDGEYKIGFYAPKSHRVTEAAKCPLAPANFEKILDTVRHFAKNHNLSVYDEESGNGLLRHVYLRRAEVSGEVLLTLVINGRALPHSEELVEEIRREHPEVTGILLNVNERATNVILGEEFITLFGKDHITDTLGGVSLKITAPSFYQVNHGAAELLYAKAKELAAPEKTDTLLDLYCGAGSIGLSMADMAGEVIGIEIVDSAVECAKFNAEENGIKNASFYAGDAKNTEKMLERAESERGAKIKPDIIILDPPRGGSSEELLRYIVKLAPRKIVYISCNPKTLARDICILRELGYDTDTVFPFDLFPATGHVESVVCLTRNLQ